MEPALVVASGVNVTVCAFMVGVPPSALVKRIEITPLAPTVTDVTYFDEICAAAGKPAV
jgi:hypothetical protein